MKLWEFLHSENQFAYLNQLKKNVSMEHLNGRGSTSDCWIQAKRFFEKTKMCKFAYDVFNFDPKKHPKVHNIATIYKLYCQPSKSVDN